MIGDWVLHFGEVARIVGIRIDNYNNSPYFKTNLHDTWYESGVDGIEPIPITPEILEKNGFRYSDLPFENFYEGYGLQIHGGNYADGHSNWYIICGINVAMNVTYVHKLQHTLKSCEIDKEIVL